MDREREHARVVPEDRLDAVAVVRVQVDVGDPLGAGVEQALDRGSGVVVDAEAGGGASLRVMHAAGDVDAVLDPAGPYGLGDVDRAGEEAGRGLVHVGEDGVVVGAEAVLDSLGTEAVLDCLGAEAVPDRLGGTADRGDVVPVVDRLDDGVRCGVDPDHLELRRGEQAQGLDEAHREIEPGR